MFGSVGIREIVLLVLVLMLLFGTRKIPKSAARSGEVYASSRRE
jgi:Sec-independent protein translocase protein TatA